jgi:FkbM family methyltransferase
VSWKMRPATMLNLALARADLAIVRRSRLDRATHAGALAHLRASGFSPSTVIDVGAATGSWTRAWAAAFPRARYFLIEPLDEFADALDSVASQIRDAHVVRATAGRAPGEVVLNVHSDLVGSSTLRESEGRTTDGIPRRVPTVAIDDLFIDSPASSPVAIKVDVQGAELAVLEGARTTLEQAEIVILEVSLLPFFVGGPVFQEVVTFMADRGFSVYDVIGAIHRPIDGALAQVDLVFVPTTSTLRLDTRFATPDQRIIQDARFRRRRPQS